MGKMGCKFKFVARTKPESRMGRYRFVWRKSHFKKEPKKKEHSFFYC